MNISVRNYKSSDYQEIKSWWDAANEVAPSKTMLPEESTFICEVDNTPILAMTLYLTNCLEIAYLENFVGNPKLKGEARLKAGPLFFELVCDIGKKLGYKRFVGFTNKEKLKTKYINAGMRQTLNSIDVFVKEL